MRNWGRLFQMLVAAPKWITWLAWTNKIRILNEAKLETRVIAIGERLGGMWSVSRSILGHPAAKGSSRSPRTHQTSPLHMGDHDQILQHIAHLAACSGPPVDSPRADRGARISETDSGARAGPPDVFSWQQQNYFRNSSKFCWRTKFSTCFLLVI